MYKAWEEAAVTWHKGDKKALCAVQNFCVSCAKTCTIWIDELPNFFYFSAMDLWVTFGICLAMLLLQCCCFFQHSYFCNVVTSFNTVTFAMLLLTSSVACIVTCGSETSKMSNLGHRHKKQKGKRTAPKHSSVQSFQGYHLQVLKQVGLRTCQKQDDFVAQQQANLFQLFEYNDNLARSVVPEQCSMGMGLASG